TDGKRLYTSLRFIIVRQPSRPTIFPYTTLFRSGRAGTARHHPRPCPARHALDRHQPVPGRRQRRLHADEECRHGHVSRQGRGAEDRKSTRLNSSHVKISYAVVCLKKKKITSKEQ